MNVEFSCPSCGVAGLVAESFAGRQVRCKQCQYRFVIPAVGQEEPDGYALEAPDTDRPDVRAMPASASESVYAPTRSDEPIANARKRRTKRPASASPRKAARPEGPGFAWRAWLIRGGLVIVVALLLIALIAPNGMVIAGATMILLGTLMFFVGFGAGAFGAFSEDFLYGLLYLLIPFYTAYYFVTRWDDLRPWLTCSALGMGLILLGTAILRPAGVEA